MIIEFFRKYDEWFKDFFLEKGLEPNLAALFNVIIVAVLFFVTIYFIDLIVKKIIIKVFNIFSNKTKSTLDDYLVLSNFPKYIAHTIPIYIIWFLVPEIFKEFPIISSLILKTIDLYIIILSILIVRSVLRSIKKYLANKDRFKDKPLESYLQLLMIFTWSIGIFILVNTITGYSTISVTTLSATSAVLLLIFKDTILGFVASIQVSVNDIIRIGDWITINKYGADGYVCEISLATVRVQNFDYTFTTIPTYSLTSDSFQNWRGMQESGGRRIKRSIIIKQSSVKFLTKEEIENYKKISLVKNYLIHREKGNDKYNNVNQVNKSLLINGKNQTNLGVFRKYIEVYLKKNPATNKDMFLMVRHLAPNEKGIPIEIYCFSNDKEWINFEHIQADIFDHILASASYFDLEIFELPTGKDFNFKN